MPDEPDVIHFDFEAIRTNSSADCRTAIQATAPAMAAAMSKPNTEAFRAFLRELPDIVLTIGAKAIEDHCTRDDVGEFDALAMHLAFAAWSLVYGDARNHRQVEVRLDDLMDGMPRVGVAMAAELVRRSGTFKSVTIPENPFTHDAVIEYEVP